MLRDACVPPCRHCWLRLPPGIALGVLNLVLAVRVSVSVATGLHAAREPTSPASIVARASALYTAHPCITPTRPHDMSAQSAASADEISGPNPSGSTVCSHICSGPPVHGISVSTPFVPGALAGIAWTQSAGSLSAVLAVGRSPAEPGLLLQGRTSARERDQKAKRRRH